MDSVGQLGEAGVRPPVNESQRLQTLYALDILDTPADERFDRVTRLACRLFDAPIALISLVDSDRQWFKSRVGLAAVETPKAHSFCAHAIMDEEVMVVPDATADERFKANPLVTGSPEIRFYAGCPVKAPNGSPLGTLCVISDQPRAFHEDDAEALHDLTQLVEQELKSLALATIDELTGITNRRGFHAMAQHTLACARRVDRPATLLMFDLDHFKEINDTYGHATGDRVLQEFGDALVLIFRDSDVVARLGGDEFVVLLTCATAQDVSRPLAALSAHLEGPARLPRIEFSVGVATFDPARHETVDDLMAKADERMYSQKRAAR